MGNIIDFTKKVSETGAGYSQAGATDLPTVIARLVNGFLTLLGVIFLLLVLYGGFSWMTSGGDSEKIKKAQGILRNAVIGLVIVLLAWAITRFVTEKIGGATVALGLQS